ncbi:MAG: glycosyl hydrolase 115 family protein, partial [Hominilimicola sp.]
MLKRVIAAVTAAAAAISVIPSVSAGAEEAAVNNSVSGYVSLSEGVKIAGKDKTPEIYIDGSDYDSVIRAVGDLKEDIKSVTGKEASVKGADLVNLMSGEDVQISGIDFAAETMTVKNYQQLENNARGIIAMYNADGTLLKAYISDNTASNISGTLNFTNLTDTEGTNVRGYLWREENGLTLEPAVDTYIYQRYTLDAWDSADIIIGTLGASDAVDALAETGDIDVSGIKDKWESFTVQEANNKIVIAGSDKRGTIYGIYDLCEKMGVSPWQWWSDTEPVTADELYINLPEEGYTEGEPSVKYRGIFLNDEYNMNQWSQSMGEGNMNNETYEKIFELLLRLKANYMWPAMHAYSTAFHNTEGNAALADKYGIVMGSSHCEPMLRNNLGELDAFQDKWEEENPDKTLYKALKNESGKSVAYYWTDHDDLGNTVDNKEFLEAYWRESVKENGGYDNIYTLGMRGVHDGSFQTNMDYATALNEIVAVQRKILKEEICDKTGRDISEIPQVFIPYKDVLKYYNDGSLVIPEDVTIMWTDDNYGYVRQNADDTERARSGRTGLYYHISYYGYPTSYLWLSSTQPGLIREELTKSYDMGSDKIWILNVGDLKPAEKEIEYFARLARNIDEVRDTDISEIYKQNAKRDFNMNDADAKEYAEVMDEYYEIANSKRPEFQRSGNFSLTAYGDEGQRYIDRYNELTERAETLYKKLSENKKYAFYELALYPIRSAKNMAIDYIQSDRAKLYSEQGRGAAMNTYAAEANTAASEIDTDTEYFNTMLDGKWNKMMNINPSKLQGCDAHITTSLNPPTADSLDYTQMEIAVDGQTELSSEPVITLSKYDMYNKFIDIFNTGYGSFDYTVSSSSAAVVLSKAAGTVYDSERIYVKLDADKAQSGVSEAVITVSQKLGDNAIDSRTINVTINNQGDVADEKTYVETDGTVSIEAEHYSNAVSNGEYEWKIEKDFGRSGDSIKIYPNLAAGVADSDVLTNSAYTEYNVVFENSGDYTLDVYRMPTLNERGNMRFAVGIDGNEPVVFKGTSAYTGSQDKNNAWSKGVLNNTEKLTATVTISEAGKHAVRIYNIAPGVVIDKLVLTKGDVPYSYFGAPESYNTTYNNILPQMPSSSEDEEISGINKLYEPDAVVGEINKESAQINGVNIIKITNNYSSAVAAVTGYDADGNMTAVNFANVDLSETAVGSAVNVPVALNLTEDTTSYAVTVFDSFENMQLIAPYKTYGTIQREAESNNIGIKADMSDYLGKKTITIIADCAIDENIKAENIKYLYGENAAADSYKYIPFAKNGQGIYYIRTGVYGESAIDETKNTIVNILPNNDGVTETVNKWSFTNGLEDDNGVKAFEVSGGAARSDDGMIKMNTTSAGDAFVSYSDPVTVMPGGKVTVEFDILYGKLSGKSMTYSISDSNGNSLAEVSINAYNPAEKASVKIGGTEILEDYSQLSNAVSRSNNLASANGATHYKNVFDFEAGRAYITVSSSAGTAEFSGKIGTVSGNVSKINFSTSYNNSERACFVD